MDSVSQRVVDYVIRSQKPIVSTEAAKDGDFIDPEFAVASQMKSLLCLPILSKRETIGVLYLENRKLSGAFTQSRVSVLNLLGGQMAVSIENAVLYSKMEEEIKERTKDIRSILENVRQGIFTFGKESKVQPGYSNYLFSIFGKKNLEGERYDKLLFSQSNINEDLLSQIRECFRSSMGAQMFQFDLNSACLPREITKKSTDNQDSQILELDWVPILNTNDEIYKIMVTVRDVSELRRAEQQAKLKSRQLNMIGQISWQLNLKDLRILLILA